MEGWGEKKKWAPGYATGVQMLWMILLHAFDTSTFETTVERFVLFSSWYQVVKVRRPVRSISLRVTVSSFSRYCARLVECSGGGCWCGCTHPVTVLALAAHSIQPDFIILADCLKTGYSRSCSFIISVYFNWINVIFTARAECEFERNCVIHHGSLFKRSVLSLSLPAHCTGILIHTEQCWTTHFAWV